MAARQDTTKALSRSERGSAQHSHTSCGFESLAWGRSPRADSASAMATLQSESRELRLQHREQFLDVLVRVPHMRGHAHGPTAHGDVDVGRGKALRQIGRHAAAEAQSEIVTRTAVGRHAGDAELGARPLSNGVRAPPQRLKDAWHRPFRDQLERGFGHRHQRKVAALPDVETPRARLKVMAVVDQASEILGLLARNPIVLDGTTALPARRNVEKSKTVRTEQPFVAGDADKIRVDAFHVEWQRAE